MRCVVNRRSSVGGMVAVVLIQSKERKGNTMSQADELREQMEAMLDSPDGRAKVEKALTVVNRPEIDAPAVWGERDAVVSLALRFKTMLPSGGDLNLAQTMAAAQHCLLTGLNPFRGEVYYYPGKAGALAIVDGYKALTRWASEECPFDEIDTDLEPGPGELHRVEVVIFRHDRREALDWYLEKGASFDRAWKLVTKSAVGIVTDKEVKQTGDPPKGWTWRQVAYKRALKNALNLSHNMPSIEELARARLETGQRGLLAEGEETRADDWEASAAIVQGGQAVHEAHAAMKARDRKARHEWESLDREAQQAKAADNSRILYGDPAFEGFGDDPPGPPPEEDDGYLEGEIVGPDDGAIPLPGLTAPPPDTMPEPAATTTEIERFFEEVKAESAKEHGHTFYKHREHLSNALALHLGPSFQYPPASDLRKWATLKSLAVQHAGREIEKAKKNGKGKSDDEANGSDATGS